MVNPDCQLAINYTSLLLDANLFDRHIPYTHVPSMFRRFDHNIYWPNVHIQYFILMRLPWIVCRNVSRRLDYFGSTEVYMRTIGTAGITRKAGMGNEMSQQYHAVPMRRCWCVCDGFRIQSGVAVGFPWGVDVVSFQSPCCDKQVVVCRFHRLSYVQFDMNAQFNGCVSLGLGVFVKTTFCNKRRLMSFY